MSILEKMTSDNIAVNWSTILIGWYGPGNYDRQLSIADVAAYARELIEANPEQPIAVLKLAGARDDETALVESSLKQLAALEPYDETTEVRKWRLYLLRELEPALSDDPLYGLIALTEFWEKFDYPDDSPHVVQGRGNDQDPQQYYTPENFLNLRKLHREWMKGEEEFLKTQ
jgi:hypothetical protein